MAKNELLPFANGEDANVLPTQQWEALTDILENGFQSGVARSEQVNRVLAQGAVASYVLGQLIVDQLNKDATLDKSALYQNLVSALQENAKDACLPLSGGTMTGAVAMLDTGCWNGASNEAYRYTELIGGAPETKGGAFIAFAEDSKMNPRSFICRSRGENGEFHDLQGDGPHLYYEGLSVERVNTKGANYICYQNGLMICWADLTMSSNGGVNWSFPIPFKTDSYGLSAIIQGSANRNWSVLQNSASATSVNIWVKDNGSSEGGANQVVRVTAVGYWM